MVKGWKQQKLTEHSELKTLADDERLIPLIKFRNHNSDRMHAETVSFAAKDVRSVTYHTLFVSVES